jgi:hypothetical protein
MMKVFKIKYQTVYQYWTSQFSEVKIKAESELAAEIELCGMFDGLTMKTQLASFEIVN